MASAKFPGASRTLSQTRTETEPAKAVPVKPAESSPQAAATDQPSADRSKIYELGGSTFSIRNNKIKPSAQNPNARVGIHDFDKTYELNQGKKGKPRHYAVEENEIEGSHDTGIYDYSKDYGNTAPEPIKAKQEEAPAPPPRKNEEPKNEKKGWFDWW